mmetsp:Transcript_31/g.63  ORF Transcript_31/g.63 Transcript_31/m.63 type:complete len:209 (-) Transcript_31:74-700(-)
MSSSSSSSPSTTTTTVVADRIRQAEALKEEGNDLFRRGKIRKARVKYSTVFAYIKGLGSSSSSSSSSSGDDGGGMAGMASSVLGIDRPTVEEDRRIRELRISCESNIALCRFKLGDYESSIDSSDRVLAIDPDHAKSLYRKGAALSRLDRDLETARDCLRKAVDLDSGDDKSKSGGPAAKELARVRRKLRDREEESRNKLAKALRGAL